MSANIVRIEKHLGLKFLYTEVGVIQKHVQWKRYKQRVKMRNELIVRHVVRLVTQWKILKHMVIKYKMGRLTKQIQRSTRQQRLNSRDFFFLFLLRKASKWKEGRARAVCI